MYRFSYIESQFADDTRVKVLRSRSQQARLKIGNTKVHYTQNKGGGVQMSVNGSVVKLYDNVFFAAKDLKSMLDKTDFLVDDLVIKESDDFEWLLG